MQRQCSKPTVITYSALISACAKSNDLKEARQLLQDMQTLPSAHFDSPDGPCKKYGELHQILLKKSLAAGGDIVSVSDKTSDPKVAALLAELHLKCAYGCAGEKLDGDMSGFEGACGAVFLDVFIDEKRPHHPNNVAMLYANGPKAQMDYNVKARNDGGVIKTKPRGPLIESSSDFLNIMNGLGCRAMRLVAHHNRLCVEPAASSQIIEDVRWPLISGSNVRHPEVSMLEVAASLQEGIMAAREATALTATFAYDKDEEKKIGMDHGIFWEASMALSKEAFAWHFFQCISHPVSFGNGVSVDSERFEL